MYTHLNQRAQHMRRTLGTATVAIVAACGLIIVGAMPAGAEPLPVPLGTAESFVVLAGAGVTVTGANTLNGDLGTFPDTSVSGTGTIAFTGTNHGGDGVTQTAKTDLVVAYDNASGQGPTLPIVADLAGEILTTGVYNSGSQILLTGALVLDAEGDEDAVFVFQAGPT